VLLTTAVAGLAVLVVGLVSIGLLRGAGDTEARRQLARQADGYAVVIDRAARNRPAFTRLVAILRQQQILLEAVDTSGATCGKRSVQVPASIALPLASGKSVSAVARIDGTRRFVEGRPLTA
jgi:hypothetical protein